MIVKNYSLENLNTFRVDVKAKLFSEVYTEKELLDLLTDESLKNEKNFILGSGSNILFTKDYEGLIIKVSIPGIKIVEEDSDSVLIEAGSGVTWNDLVNYCVNRNYGGIENLTLIPGTVGAAPIQNIGAYGQELADTFVELNGVFVESGEKKNYSKSDCRFSYRSSIFKEELKNNFIITSVKLKLTKNPAPTIVYKTLSEYLSTKNIVHPTLKDISNAVAEIRRSKLPDPVTIGNAGSFFKNPVISQDTFSGLKSQYPDIASFYADAGQVKISAGWLIEKCGWKGKRVGDVSTSPDHALVVCNFGNATGLEILEFAMRIKEEVASKFGIRLEEEVNIL